MGAIDALNEDKGLELSALSWIGRGEFEPDARICATPARCALIMSWGCNACNGRLLALESKRKR